MDLELRSRFDAYAGLGAGEAPSVWTPELVGLRMIEAYRVLARMPSSWGPRAPRNAWPAVLQEWEDLLDMSAWRNRLAEEPKADPPTKEEVSRADEALGWPMDHLADNRLHADALMVWASCLASGQSIKRRLAKRNALASAHAAQMMNIENARRKAKRDKIAADVVRWANRKLKAAGGDKSRCQAIKANAQIRFERAVTEAEAWATEITPAQAMPGKVRIEKTMTRYRKAACAMLAEALNIGSVVPRLPAEEISADERRTDD